MGEDIFHLGIKALIRNKKGDILVLEVNQALLIGKTDLYAWDLPGGRIQKGTTVEQTLEREVAEEIGVHGVHGTKAVGMVLATRRIPVGDDTVGLILSVWECNIPEDAEIVLSEEHSGYRWCAPAEAAKLLADKYPADFCALIASL
jgi:8-oxo-dGTP pyrophosphatase MutT (NUDIX family)